MYSVSEGITITSMLEVKDVLVALDYVANRSGVDGIGGILDWLFAA